MHLWKGSLVFLLAGLAPIAAPEPAQAQNCSILTGGNPCAAGCPDECSPILCPGNVLCRARCGGSSCNVTCSPGPCGTGCPDECSPILCPGNALCRTRCGGSPCNVACSPGPCGAGCPDECSPVLCPGNALCRTDCGGSPCNLTCSPGPCGAGCPDECSFVLCPQNPCACSESGEGCIVTANCCDDLVCAFPQQTCRHDPSELGEPCGPLAPCRAGLRCITLTCQEPRKVGEGCLVGSDCADGLDCRPCFVEGCRAPLMCFPRGEARLFDEATCRSYFSEALQEDAARSGVTRSYGYGSAAAVGVGGSFEIGTVYGQDGRYGCYLTTCLGGTVDVEIGSFVSVGFYTSLDDFQGSAVVIIEEAGEGLVFSSSQVIGPSGALVGTASCLAIEASLAPITAGVFDCDTVVNSFSVSPPTTTLTAPITTTTSTTLPVLGLPALVGHLAEALPDPDLETGKARRAARKLAKLYRRAERQLTKAAAASGKKQARLYTKARRFLEKLRRLAQRSAEKGRLNVPLTPIEALVEAVLVRLPAG